MTKDEYVGLLGRGIGTWNAWRAENDEVPDLSSANLRAVDLSGFDLSRVDLRRADLRGRSAAIRTCQVRILRVRISSKRCSTAPILPGRSSTVPPSLIVPSSLRRETGRWPSAMTRSAAAPLSRTGLLRDRSKSGRCERYISVWTVVRFAEEM